MLLTELRVPWEEGVQETHEEKNCELPAECGESGWRARIFPVDVGTGGFVVSSTARLLGELGLKGKKLHCATRELTEEEQKASFWLWLER